MIIKITENYSDIFEYAKVKCDANDYKVALRYALDALSIKETDEVYFLLARIYFGLEQNDICLNYCFKILSLGGYSDELQSAVLKLIARALGKMGLYMRAFYYMVRSNPDYQSPTPEEMELETLAEESEREALEKKENDFQGLHFAREERSLYNEKTIERAVHLADMGDFSQAVRLMESLYEDGDGYNESLYFLAHLYMMDSNADKAGELYVKISQRDPEDGNSLYSLSICDEKYLPYLKERLENFIPKVPKNTVQALFAAVNAEMYPKALEFAEALIGEEPQNRYYQLLHFVSLWNVGRFDEAFDVLENVLNLAPSFYPLKMLESISFPDKFKMPFFDFPFELTERIAKKVRLKRTFEKALEEEDFKIATVFSLTVMDNYSDKFAIIEKLRDVDTEACIDVLCRVLHSFKCPDDIRRFALLSLLEKNKMKKCGIVVDGIYATVKLKLPPSFDEYDDKLAEAYMDAFSHLAMMSSSFENQLIKAAERVYKRYEDIKKISHLQEYLSEYMMYEFLKKIGFPDINGFFASIGVNYDLISNTYYIYEAIVHE